MGKIIDIRDKKAQRPLTAEEAAKRAYKEHFRKTPVENEPEGLASGQAEKDGSMHLEDEKNGN
ncbi:hypothetical protein BTA51_13345 [Hahella sp. CCB-MM4]|uniref:hypothetical protein n=1 Tax=Hahella sp. (strain CCB-MM4) TaxID=1926491 RepID=UPI000B9AEC15|nr:hypothetical protein [Hahella sp. CCB-MM4]OZG72940.1 hypothetical protein BTA51_13345 [Hahella sp. CCB-MM4]